MPTYDYKCAHCAEAAARFQTIGDYTRTPDRPACAQHGEMERSLSVVPAMSGLANALAGDRHYADLRAPDGTDISSRTKHREYMQRTGLAVTGDFKETWAKEQTVRELTRSAQHVDKELRSEITQQVMTAVAQPD